MGGDDIYMCVFPTDKMGFDGRKLMYKFGNPKQQIYGQEAIDGALELEKENDIHWDYAIEKCRSR
tara:strand:- start:228 stop:422 length:195 start_codon:yes stop_codon:yes gene_type:complete